MGEFGEKEVEIAISPLGLTRESSERPPRGMKRCAQCERSYWVMLSFLFLYLLHRERDRFGPRLVVNRPRCSLGSCIFEGSTTFPPVCCCRVESARNAPFTLSKLHSFTLPSLLFGSHIKSGSGRPGVNTLFSHIIIFQNVVKGLIRREVFPCQFPDPRNPPYS